MDGKEGGLGSVVMDDSDVGFIDGDYSLSEESSFYGNEDTKAEYEGRVAAYNPRDYWNIVQWNIQCMVIQQVQSLPRGTKRKLVELSSSPPATIKEIVPSCMSPSQSQTVEEPNSVLRKPYNPYEGEKSSKQLSETLDDFLLRLKPSTSTLGDIGPWICVANPHSVYRPANENIAAFKQEGSKALARYTSRKIELENKHSNKVRGGITRILQPERDLLEARIIEVAQSFGVTQGKWMLFLPVDAVDRVWSVIAKAVINDELGCSAKVATDDGDPKNKFRLMCIHTIDFAMLQDVKRVLNKLLQLGLIEDNSGKPAVIYYKCDAYTYLDISSGNEYKLRASMYNSKELLPDMST